MEEYETLDPAIEGFFAERKEAWLKKQLKANMSEQEKLEKELECQEPSRCLTGCQMQHQELKVGLYHLIPVSLATQVRVSGRKIRLMELM